MLEGYPKILFYYILISLALMPLHLATVVEIKAIVKFLRGSSFCVTSSPPVDWFDAVRACWIGGMFFFLVGVLFCLIENCCGDETSKDYGLTGTVVLLAGQHLDLLILLCDPLRQKSWIPRAASWVAARKIVRHQS